MPRPRRLGILAVVLATLGPAARGDTVVMKNGNVYRGEIDRDNTIVFIFDGLKRVVVRETKIDRIESDASYRNLERFQLVQPLVVHGGAMPPYALNVQADPLGRQGTAVVPLRRPAVERAGPHGAGDQRARPAHGQAAAGWTGSGRASWRRARSPATWCSALLARVDRKDQNERLRVARFLIQAEWYAEAKRELDAVAGEFPELRETIDTARASVVQLEAAQLRDEIAVRRRAQQPREVAARLKAFPIEGVSAAVLTEVRDAIRQDEAQAAADRSLADDLRQLAGPPPRGGASGLEGAARRGHAGPGRGPRRGPRPVRGLAEASKAEAGPTDEARFALAMSGFVVGTEGAVADLETAATLWKARDLVRDYLASRDAAARADLLEKLERSHRPAIRRSAETRPLDLDR